MEELNYRAIYSVMEFIFIYTGIFMMIAGALYLLFPGKKLKHDVD